MFLEEEVSSQRKQLYENNSGSDMNHESELDYVGESEEVKKTPLVRMNMMGE